LARIHDGAENIEAIEKRLWSAADTLRANSNLAANEFFMPVMGLSFLGALSLFF
jgi:type I restriction enzyme M protein